MRHECNKGANNVAWSICCVCEGRIHLPGCTSKRDRKKDCCEARHKMLAEQGHLFGLSDSSQPMYDQINKTWAE